MIESLYITKSRIRRGLLSLFFTNPSQRYYLRELQRLLGHSAGSIRRELLRFQEDDLLGTQSVGNLLYYYLNTSHPLFKELKAIVSRTIGVEGSLRQTLSSVKNVKTAFIYGSFAKNEERTASDIDLMIIGDPDTSDLNEKIAVLEKKLRREISPTIYSVREYRARKRSGSGFVADLLRNPRIILVGKDDDL